jgi:integrase
MIIEEIFKEYIELKKPTISNQTYVTSVSYFENHIKPLLGSLSLNELNYKDYQNFANNLLNNPSPVSGKILKVKTAKHVLSILSSIVKYAKMNEYYKGDDRVKYVELPKFDNRCYFTPNADTQRKYIKAILTFNEPIYKDIFLFLLHGRRLSEVLTLSWEFIDMNEYIMYLPANKNKSKKNLSFSLTDKQIHVLRSYQLIEHEVQITPFIKGYVFKNPNTGERYKDVRKAWHRLLNGANLPKIRIHDIRHLVATYLVNELQLPVEQVSHTLGHSDIKITQQYINPKPQNARDAMNSLFRSIENENEGYIYDNESSYTHKVHTDVT